MAVPVLRLAFLVVVMQVVLLVLLVLLVTLLPHLAILVVVLLLAVLRAIWHLLKWLILNCLVLWLLVQRLSLIILLLLLLRLFVDSYLDQLGLLLDRREKLASSNLSFSKKALRLRLLDEEIEDLYFIIVHLLHNKPLFDEPTGICSNRNLCRN